MADDLVGRVALVTGAGRGLGREIALGLAARGARVVLLARTQPERDMVAAEIRATGGTAVAIATGGMVPRGADAVVMVEYTDARGNCLLEAAFALNRRAAAAGERSSPDSLLTARGDRRLICPNSVSSN